MADEPIAASQLTEEKNLLQLYKLSYKFPVSSFNVISTSLVGFGFGIYLWLILGRNEVGPILKEVLKLGISLVPSILGFLIAGFTVFVTITRPGVFAMMARKQFRKTGQSFLKYNLSAFMLAFAHYIAYLGICVLLVYFGQPNGALTSLARWGATWFFADPKWGYDLIVAGFTVLFASWTWYLVMLLKSFIYNVYQVVVTSVRWELEDHERNQAAGI